MTADIARKNIALNEPQKSVEKIRAEKIVLEHETELNRKVKEGKFIYKFSLNSYELNGEFSYMYENKKKEYHETLNEISNEIALIYKKRGFKSHYYICNSGYSDCVYNFVVNWEPIKNVSERKVQTYCVIS